MKDYTLYEKPDIVDIGFPVKIANNFDNGPGMKYYSHWHEQMEILCVIEGKALINVDSLSLEAKAGDVVFINSNEIHELYSITDSLNHYCIIFDTSFLKGDFNENWEQKYITPIVNNLIQFRNKITEDSKVMECIQSIMTEWKNKLDGYELMIKASVYRLLGILYRNYVEKILTEKEYAARMHNLDRLNKVFLHIEKNHMNPITIDQLARMLCISRYHFCHIFKNMTGKTVNEYINFIRIE